MTAKNEAAKTSMLDDSIEPTPRSWSGCGRPAWTGVHGT